MKNYFKISLILLALPITGYSFSEVDSETSIKSPDKDSVSQLFSFSYNYTRTLVSHGETSKDSGFKSFTGSTNLLVHQFGTTYGKEFFSGSRFSITPLAEIGLITASESINSSGSSSSVDSLDKASGYYASAGLSFNLNSYDTYYNTQTFLSARAIQSKTNYFLRYQDLNTDSRSYELNYAEDLTSMEASVGVRFFNYKKKMLSTFSLTGKSFPSVKYTAKATQGDKSFKLSKLANFDRQALSINFGFGILF